MMLTGPPLTKESEGWTGLKSWLLKSIHDAQKQLEQVGATEAEHNATRGAIKAWRALIAAVEPKPIPEDHQEGEYFTD